MHLTGSLRSTTFPYAPRHAPLASGSLAYFDEGRGDPLVFVHGLGCDFTHFEHLARPLSRTHRVIGVDMPGCGMSSKHHARHSIATHTDALLELLAHLDLPRVTLVGHSAGGMVSTLAALREPTCVERLVLINSAGIRRYPRVARPIVRAVMRPGLLEATLERAAMPLIGRIFHQRNAYTEQFVADSLNRPRHPLLAEMAKVFSDLLPDLVEAPVREHAPQMTMPVLVIWGDRDRLVPMGDVAQVAARFPRGRLAVIRDCGHMPMIESPETVVTLLRNFVAPATEAPWSSAWRPGLHGSRAATDGAE
jgi:pimeloyl-ACP methyl ester carboxylesterase